MFTPDREQVRAFFCETWRKRSEGALLTPLETIAADWMAEHPEYHRWLDDPQAAREATFDSGNPFLHLAMHVSIAEQLQIDQPPGIRAAWQQLLARRGSAHEAAHEVMECLGPILWEAQRLQREPDGAAYVECLRRRATAGPASSR